MATRASAVGVGFRAQSVRHLRSHGAFLYKRSTGQHLTLVETKGDVPELPDELVAEAYGVENWPHLLHLLEDGDDVVKRRVLVAMASVFKLPQDLTMCLKQGVLELIERGIAGDDPEIQRLSARVFSVILASPMGRTEFMNSESAIAILPVFTAAADEETASNIYDGFLSLSRSFVGAQQLTKHSYMQVVLTHLKRGSISKNLRCRVLQLLKNLVNDGNEGTAIRAIDLDGMELCAKYLYDDSTELRVAACDAIAAMGFVEKAKRVAVSKGIVKKLCHLLSENKWQVAAASAGALMTIAVNDDAKRAIVENDALSVINQLLQSPKYLVQLNTVKLIAVIASFPPARRQLNVSSTEYHLRALMAADEDALLVKSARLALHAVQWQP
ncbi:hypothetical protein ATCC90586_001847 [Pythium insidiosum]|nr:hypothetical protein ATCC90586_001847 [Pythium insidiosum]